MAQDANYYNNCKCVIFNRLYHPSNDGASDGLDRSEQMAYIHYFYIRYYVVLLFCNVTCIYVKCQSESYDPSNLCLVSWFVACYHIYFVDDHMECVLIVKDLNKKA